VTGARPIRVLVVDDESQILLLVRATLEKSGFTVVTLNDPRQVVELAQREKPDLILSDLMMPMLDGYGVVAALRQDPRTAAIPIAFLTAAPTHENLSKAFSSGIVAYFEKPFHPAKLGAQIRRLLSDLELRPTQLFGVIRHTPIGLVLDFLQQQRRTGVLSLTTKAGEGKVVLSQGRISQASFGDESDATAAIARMKSESEGDFAFVALDGAAEDVIELDPVSSGAPEELDEIDIVDEDGAAIPEIAELEAVRSEKLLIVDDDQALVHLLKKHFVQSGFEVVTAANGRAGFTLALEQRPDLILSDVAMPEIDGWQLFHRVRSDYRINEMRFFFLSGQSGFEEKLRALGVDAEAFFEKGVLFGQILKRVDQILAPRRDLDLLLSRPLTAPFTSRISPLGIKYVLRLLGTHQRNAELRVENLWHKLRATIIGGELAACADEGLVPSSGKEAFLELCSLTTGELTLSAGPGSGAKLGALNTLVNAAEDELTEAERQVMDTHLVSAPSLKFNAHLLDFYAQVAPESAQPIIAGVRAGRSPREIIGSLDMSPLEIEDVLKDLARKHVIVFDGES
jgi:DNA-binding response OmpR family regulator